MSYSTEAILFFGFPIDVYSESADYSRDGDVEQACFGSDGDLTHYVALKCANHQVGLGNVRRFDAWPADGPAWHLAPVRL